MATPPTGVAEQEAAAVTTHIPASPGSVAHVPNGAGSAELEAGPETNANVEPPAPIAQPVQEAPTASELQTRLLERLMEQVAAMQLTQQATAQALAAQALASDSSTGTSTT